MTLQRMRLGKFAQDPSGALYGRISGLGMGSTTIMSQEALSHDGKPYLKLCADSGAASYEVGAAFRREKDGMVYYSVSLESPIFPVSINAALFPDAENEGMYNLVWNRPEIPALAADIASNVGLTKGRRYIGSGAAP